MTKPKLGCYYCNNPEIQRQGICYHQLIQMDEHICFCEEGDCFGGSFKEICKYQTYAERKKSHS